MVQLRALNRIVLMLLLVIFASSSVWINSASASAAMEERAVRIEQEDKVRGLQGMQAWRRKTRMNHGSFRSPRKHLVNPTATSQLPFQASQLPV
ncbi:hypothetical protein ACE6H2_016346 [Prunus campanulata]